MTGIAIRVPDAPVARRHKAREARGRRALGRNLPHVGRRQRWRLRRMGWWA